VSWKFLASPTNIVWSSVLLGRPVNVSVSGVWIQVEDEVAQIPLAVQTIARANADPKELRKILIATVLRYKSIVNDEEEPFSLTEDDLRNAANYILTVNDLQDEGAIVLNVRRR
jgi:hypothetical protein